MVPIEGSYQSTLDGFRLQPLQTLHNTNISHEATKAGILFWCTLCEDRHRPYKNVSDWRKHEKTHVETYYCMLRGPLEQTKGSSKCTLCGISNPSEKHLGAHNIQTCGEGVLGSFSCKRRTDLVRHLRNCHDVLGKAQGEAIADKCKETTNKQAWSCGFCGHLVHIFGDRLKHVATHFERGQTLDEWDTTKEIEGLLSQPGMVSAWQWQLAASPMGWESSEFIWKKHVVKDLQRDLEVGPADTKHAATLAKAAYEARQPRWDLLHGNMPLATAPTYGTLGPSVIVPTSNYDSITERTFEHNSNHHQSRFVANPAETLHNGVPGFGGIPMASYGYSTFPASSLEDGGSSIQTPWLLDPRQTWSSAVDQYTSINGYQEYSNATMDAPDTDEMLD